MDTLETKSGLDRALKELYFTKFRLKFKAVEEIQTSEYKGSAFRGCFGESFRSLVCRYPGKECEFCQLLFKCIFSELYVAPLNRNHHLTGKYTHPPRPYIIVPMESRDRIFISGDVFYFDLILIGSTIKFYSTITDVIKNMGEVGLGHNHSKFVAISIEYYTPDGSWNPLPAIGPPYVITTKDLRQMPINKVVTLKFETPVRLLKGRKPIKDNPPFDVFIENLAKRASLLSHLYCSAEWVNTDRAFISGDSVGIKSSQLEWRDWARYSGTKGKILFFDGHLGEITYEGNLKPWSELINLGTIFHSGSTATFGLGRYSITNYE